MYTPSYALGWPWCIVSTFVLKDAFLYVWKMITKVKDKWANVWYAYYSIIHKADLFIYILVLNISTKYMY